MTMLTHEDALSAATTIAPTATQILNSPPQTHGPYGRLTIGCVCIEARIIRVSSTAVQDKPRLKRAVGEYKRPTFPAVGEYKMPTVPIDNSHTTIVDRSVVKMVSTYRVRAGH